MPSWKAVISLAKQWVEPGKTIGMIGGGQLGRMMALSAKEAGYRIVVLDPSEDCPASQAADMHIAAAYDDRDALLSLAQNSDVITYEFENIDSEALEWLCERAHVPQGAELIRITQDRILEKSALTASGVKVAPYHVIAERGILEERAGELGFPCVLKTSRGGYDGKGQAVIRSREDIEQAAQLLEYGPCVLEAWVPFEKEISVIIHRNSDGDTACLPVGENIHVRNILHETIVPARIGEHTAAAAVELAKKVADHLKLVGTLAVEMFLGHDGTLYVNELAPRPHNSGHYSIEACSISQFGQHIRAICNWPLRQPELLKPAVMVNILGQHMEKVLQAVKHHPDWSVHLYGKAEAKINRKMGHITILAEELEPVIAEIREHPIWRSREP